ncbi:cation transporter [uncultured Tyzzerella sp.]|uniref:sodium:calcium antiporter n=1 Tax=uncultured Tyzzerella sp. TaxID=2321398 RepID=UPI002942E404|nr:cation transporter [uncultured Tyzzerella sp.]
MIYVQYLILAGFVVFLSIFLSKYVDALDKKTNLSGAFIGGVLLAAVTSLPEFITSLTAIFSLNQPNLVQGNVFGSNIFNLTIIGACILLFPKRFKNSYLSKSHLLTSIFTIIIFFICLLGMKFNYSINLGFLNVSYASIIILILYAINIAKSNDNTSDDNTDTIDDNIVNLTVKQIIFRFVVCSLLLVIFSVLLTNVTDKLNTKLNLGTTIGGAIFLGIATSLPELTSSFNLVRLGNFNASFGNVIGSNIFNFTILSIGDIFYSKGNIFSPDKQSFNIIIWGIISTIIVISTLYTKKSEKTSMFLGLLIIISYISSILFSI